MKPCMWIKPCRKYRRNECPINLRECEDYSPKEDSKEEQFNKVHFLKWVKRHDWENMDKDLILRHLKTYFG